MVFRELRPISLRHRNKNCATAGDDLKYKPRTEVTMQIDFFDLKTSDFIPTTCSRKLSTYFPHLCFRIQKIRLDPCHPGVRSILAKAKERLAQAHFNPAASDGRLRNPEEIRVKSLCGFITEQVCYNILTYYNLYPESVKIELDSSQSPINQIDLRVRKSWHDHDGQPQNEVYSIEVRSSFPFKSVRAAIDQDFDILGSYSNAVKPDEVEKDFYLRFLYEIDIPRSSHVYYTTQDGWQKINYSASITKALTDHYFDAGNNLRKPLFLYFVGGATKEMMKDKSIAYSERMRSDSFNEEGTGSYRKIKIRNALDAVAMMQLIFAVQNGRPS